MDFIAMAITKVLKSSFLYSVPALAMMRSLSGEVAMVGRSNVGKSSLINMVCHKKDLARTSKLPGRTRHAVVYELVLAENDLPKAITLVDLPGFGFAAMSKTEAQECEQLIFSYIADRKSLQQLFLLLDIRREADERERHIVELAQERGIELYIVMTKADKLPLSQRKPALKKLALSLGIRPESLVLHSTHDEDSTKNVQTLIYRKAI